MTDVPSDMISFAGKIMMLSGIFHFSVTSWGRTREHNARVGGVADSQHLKWLAVDVVRDIDCDKQAFIDACQSMNLQVIDEPDHLHVQAGRPSPQ